MGEEELEDKTNRNAANQAREVERTAEELAALDLEAQNRGEQQRKRHLHDRTDHIIEAELEGLETVLAGKDINVILQPHKGTPSDVLHFKERELHHLEERQIGEHEKQQQRQHQKDHRADDLLPAHTLAPFEKALFGLCSGLNRCTHRFSSL